tara:strand:- start:676 stop:816 length:141 start_codon:yes stop_codon:yes gene_type:complete
MPKKKKDQFSSYKKYRLVDGTTFKASSKEDAVEYASKVGTALESEK